MFTFHAYRSWMPDHRLGYTKNGVGVLPTDLEMNKWYDERAHFDEVRFDEAFQQVAIDAIKEVCVRKNYLLYYAVAISTHAHAVVGWDDEAIEHSSVHDTIKRIVGFKLAQHTGIKGRKWLSMGRDEKPVLTRRHFFHLVTEYLPDHHGATYTMKGLPS
jgi:hypothetical protein